MKTTSQSKALFLIGTVMLCLSGCSKEPPVTNADRGPAATGTSGNTVAHKFKIVYIPKQTGNAYFDAVIAGFTKASGELGYDFTTVAPSTAEATAQISFIKDQVQQRVDAIAITPDSPDAIKPALKEAMSRGIKVVTVDADMTGNEDARDACVLPMDFNITGKSQIELMSELMSNKGEFAILSATTDAPNQNFWIQGMKTTLQDPKYKDLKLVGIVYGNDEDQKSQTEAQGLLTKYPNLSGILAPTSVGIVAAAHAVETAGVANRVHVTGLGMPSKLQSYIKNGTMQKFALWDPAEMGYLSGYLLDGILKGTIKPAAGVTFKSGTLGEKKLGDKNIIVTGPPLIFDKTNIEKYKF